MNASLGKNRSGHIPISRLLGTWQASSCFLWPEPHEAALSVSDWIGSVLKSALLGSRSLHLYCEVKVTSVPDLAVHPE